MPVEGLSKRFFRRPKTELANCRLIEDPGMVLVGTHRPRKGTTRHHSQLQGADIVIIYGELSDRMGYLLTMFRDQDLVPGHRITRKPIADGYGGDAGRPQQFVFERLLVIEQ